MDIAGLSCFIWGVAFSAACILFNFTRWSEWDLTQPVTHETWENAPKGLAFVPLLIALSWSTPAEAFTLNPLPSFVWERLFLLAAGIGLGTIAARSLE